MTEFIEFGSMEAADRAREEHAEYRCPIDDDKRQKTVAFVSDTPESVLQRIEAEAVEGLSESGQRSNTVPLGEGERSRISDLGGFDGPPTVFHWRSAKGTFAREGIADQFHDAMGSLADYDDPIEGAEEYVREYQRRGSSGGKRDVGEEDIRSRQREQRAATREQEEGCDHARDVCRNGDPQACEFLEEACGFDPDEVDDILGANDDDPANAPPDEITGKAAGALSRSWQGYKGAIAELGDALDAAREAWKNADAAAEAINGIRENHSQDAMHFDALEVANADLLDFTRMAAADCHECHADHSDHDHAVTSDDVEDLRKFVGDGAPDTPVGTPDETDESLAEVSDEQLAERAPKRPEPAGMDTDPKGPAAPIDTSPNHDPAGYPDTPQSVYLRDTPVAPSDVQRTEPGANAIYGRDDQRDQRRHRERLDAVAAADATADETTPDGSEQFAAEQQGTLGVGVDAEETAEEKQVTLGGANVDDSPGALPADWRREGDEFRAGPYRVRIDGTGSRYKVRLIAPDHRFDVATGLRTYEEAATVAEGFAERVPPDKVSFHSNDAQVPEAAAAAKADVATDSGGLGEFTT